MDWGGGGGGGEQAVARGFKILSQCNTCICVFVLSLLLVLRVFPSDFSGFPCS